MLEMECSRLPKMMLEGYQGGKRRGRSRLCWLDNVGSDLRKLYVAKWSGTTKDGWVCSKIIEEAEVLRGLYQMMMIELNLF